MVELLGPGKKSTGGFWLGVKFFFWQLNRESSEVLANLHYWAEIAVLFDANSNNCIQCQKMISHPFDFSVDFYPDKWYTIQ